MKKMFSLLVCTLALVLPCMAADIPEYVYTDSKPLFPAIVYAVSHGQGSNWKEATFASIDAQQNVYIIQNVTGVAGLSRARFTLTITVTNGKLDYKLSDIMTKAVSEKEWVSQRTLMLFDMRTLKNNFNTILPQVMTDDTLYASAKKEAASYKIGQKASEAKAYSSALANPAGKLLYPAFYNAFLRAKASLPLIKNATIESIDCAGDSFTIGNINALNGKDPKTYTISVSRSGTDLICAIKKVDPLDAAFAITASDKALENLPVFDLDNIGKALCAEIQNTITKDSDFAKSKSEFFSDPQMVVLCAEGLTGITKDDFFNAEMKGSAASVTGTLNDAEKNTDENFTDYAYKLTIYIKRPGTSVITGHIIFYTNNKDLAQTSKDSPVSFTGAIAALNTGMRTQLLITDKK